MTNRGPSGTGGVHRGPGPPTSGLSQNYWTSSSSYSLLVVQVLFNRLQRLLRGVQISVTFYLVRELEEFLLEVLLLEVLTLPLKLVGRQSLPLLRYLLLSVCFALVQDELLPPLNGIVHLGGHEGL